MLTRLRALPEYVKFRIILVAAFLTFTGMLAVIGAHPSPEARCRAYGYSDAIYIIQPDGQTREWLCYSLPSDDLKVPYRSAYLADLDA